MWRRSIAVLFAIGVAALIIFPVKLLAQNYPQYDGIYLRMKSGEFVELPNSPTKGAHRLIFSAKGKYQSQLNLGGGSGLVGMGTYFSPEDFQNSSIVDIRNVKSIVVVGIAPQLLGLHALVDAKTANEEFVLDPTGSVQHIFNGNTITLPASETPDLFTRNICAVGSNNMRVRRISQFVTEYEPNQGEHWDGRIYFVGGDGRCSVASKNATIMEVVLDGRMIANFRTRAGTKAAESTNQASPAAQVPGLASDESIEQTFSILQSLIESPCDASCPLEAGGALFEVAQTYPEGSHINNLKSICALSVREGKLTCIPTYLSPGDDWTPFRFFYVFQSSCPQCSVSFAILRRDADLTATQDKVFGYLADYVTE